MIYIGLPVKEQYKIAYRAIREMENAWWNFGQQDYLDTYDKYAPHFTHWVYVKAVLSFQIRDHKFCGKPTPQKAIYYED